ncbi:hypothetical protein V6N12_039141 [Hibiscus sabdariffa]|uniref:K Homology domain-containing protein n=1 Tax=Hibiscus sabdariffa TaxID=183260 RepID=A0ABR2E3A8_9ROSI
MPYIWLTPLLVDLCLCIVLPIWNQVKQRYGHSGQVSSLYELDLRTYSWQTEIAYTLIEQQEGRMRLSEDKISFVSLLADQRYCGVYYHGKEEIRFLIKQDPTFWSYRPMSELMVCAAVDDVRCLLYLYHRMMEKLTERSKWCLSVRGALYCRCFCIHAYNQAEWPPIHPVPDRLKVGWNPPEDELFVIIDVPQGKMGRVIGRKGSSILAIKASCK